MSESLHPFSSVASCWLKKLLATLWRAKFQYLSTVVMIQYDWIVRCRVTMIQSLIYAYISIKILCSNIFRFFLDNYNIVYSTMSHRKTIVFFHSLFHFLQIRLCPIFSDGLFLMNKKMDVRFDSL